MIKKAKNILFVCHTPFHVYISEKIVNQYFSNSYNYLCVRKSCMENNISSASFQDVFSFGDCGGSILNKNKVETAYSKILSFIADKQIKHIFLCHIECPLNNSLFFSNRLAGCVFEIFSDGVAVYRTCKVSWFDFFRNNLKRLSYYFGVSSKYTPYLGKKTGIDHKRVQAVYAFNSHLVPTTAQKKDITLVKKNCINSGVIFLDQPLWNWCEDSLWCDYIRKVIFYIDKKYPNEKKFFKTHHRSRDKEKEAFKKAGYIIIDDEICIEQLNESCGFNVIISCLSSSLIHCNWIFNEVKVISLISQDILFKNDPSFNEVLRIFKKNKIPIKVIDS